MVRWMDNVRPEDIIKLKSKKEYLQDRKIQWFSHLERKGVLGLVNIEPQVLN